MTAEELRILFGVLILTYLMGFGYAIWNAFRNRKH